MWLKLSYAEVAGEMLRYFDDTFKNNKNSNKTQKYP